MSAVGNKIPNVSNLIRKADYGVEKLDIKSNYFTTVDYNRFTNKKLDLKIKQEWLTS